MRRQDPVLAGDGDHGHGDLGLASALDSSASGVQNPREFTQHIAFVDADNGHLQPLKRLGKRIKLRRTGYCCIVSMASIFQNASLFPEPQQEAILYKRLLDL